MAAVYHSVEWKSNPKADVRLSRSEEISLATRTLFPEPFMTGCPWSSYMGRTWRPLNAR